MLKSSSLRPSMGSTLRHALLAAGLVLAAPLPAAAAEPAVQAAIVERAGGDVRAFYVHHAEPLWFTAAGSLRPAAHELVRLIETADYDGLDPVQLRAGELE